MSIREREGCIEIERGPHLVDIGDELRGSFVELISGTCVQDSRSTPKQPPVVAGASLQRGNTCGGHGERVKESIGEEDGGEERKK